MTQHNHGGTTEDLAAYRIQRARDCIKESRILFDSKEYYGANNRAYYAIFHAVNAIHALDGNVYKRHKDAIANFNKNYIKTETFPREIGKKISEAEQIRAASDYDDFYIASREEAQRQIELAEELTEMIEQYFKKKVEDLKK